MERRKRRSKEEMYQLIESYLASGLSQRMYRIQAHLTKSTFEHWLKKYCQEKGIIKSLKITKSFVPVKLTDNSSQANNERQQIQINYPNGVQLQCSLGIGISQIKELIGL